MYKKKKQCPYMVSPTFKTHSTSTITSTKISRPSIGTRQGKASFDRARKLTIPGMDSLGKNYMQKEFQTNLLILSHVTED